MINPFDGLQESAFNIVTATMGEDATWTPNGSSVAQVGRVLFNNPTDSRKLAETEYDPDQNRMEYRKGIFDGLKESVAAGNREYVVIKGIEYFISQILTFYDGKTLIATLDVKDI